MPNFSTDNAIEAVLADIPLFCEGIMGIGVFTFLFLTKQVKLVAIFLYASTFMAFVAATLDLSQVLTRGPQVTANGTGFQSQTALIYAREISLSVSIFLLDLFFWMLVSRCPRGGSDDMRSELSTRKTSPPRTHSASWNRWGLVGTLLKWTTLTALISVPLLQMIWRLIPSERRYTPVYVAESTIQTSVTAIFILKFTLNIIISPLDNRWRALQLYSVPIASLVLGIGLGIGNLAVFAFAETALGRLLRAVEVYLLILHSLYTTFQDFSEKHHPNRAEQVHLPSEKTAESNYVGSLPVTYVPTRTSKIGTNDFYSRTNLQTRRASTISWVIPSPPQRNSAQPSRVNSVGDSDTVLARYTPPPVQSMSVKEPSNVSPFQPRDLSFLQQDYDQQSVQDDRRNIERPVTSVSLSYYTMEQTTSGKEGANSPDIPNVGPAATGSSHQGSVTSLDELFRQQTELDKSIAALRLTSTLLSGSASYNDQEAFAEPKVDQSRTTLTSSKTESISNRSEFSLSIFPDPPAEIQEVSSKYEYSLEPSQKQARAMLPGDSKKGRYVVEPAAPIQEELIVPGNSGNALQSASSQQAQFDVTSFIGDLSESSRTSMDDVNKEIPSAVTNVAGLRPMILKITTTTRESAASPTTSPARSYDNERTSMSTPTSLRPLLLAQPSSSRMMPLQSVSMVPLAQRRARGGTISSNTRRPVIGLPQMYEEREDGKYEQPRAAPVALTRTL